MAEQRLCERHGVAKGEDEGGVRYGRGDCPDGQCVEPGGDVGIQVQAAVVGSQVAPERRAVCRNRAMHARGGPAVLAATALRGRPRVRARHQGTRHTAEVRVVRRVTGGG